jgi:hypothetical protein
MDEDIKRTAYAQQGLDFVTLFSAKFHIANVSGYAPVLREPHAETTAGGKQAIQHMVLQPKIQGDPVLTIGYVNVASKQAKIRTYDCMSTMHGMRFPGRPFILDQAAYQTFFDKVTEFMRRQGMLVDVETRPPAMTHSSLRPAARGSELADIVLWVLLIVISVGPAMAAYLRIAGRI